MNITYQDRITRVDLAASPDVLFVFGDNMARRGYGGQAREMRGAPNAVGIPTKRAPSMTPSAFFSDDDFLWAKPEIDAAFARLEAHIRVGGRVVWPKDGVGTGLAELPQRSPLIWRYIESMRAYLESI